MGRKAKVPEYQNVRVVLDSGVYLDGMSISTMRSMLDSFDEQTAKEGLFDVIFDVDTETGYYNDTYSVISVVGWRKETDAELHGRLIKEGQDKSNLRQRELSQLQALAKKLNVKVELQDK